MPRNSVALWQKVDKGTDVTFLHFSDRFISDSHSSSLSDIRRESKHAGSRLHIDLPCVQFQCVIAYHLLDQ